MGARAAWGQTGRLAQGLPEYRGHRLRLHRGLPVPDHVRPAVGSLSGGMLQACNSPCSSALPDALDTVRHGISLYMAR